MIWSWYDHVICWWYDMMILQGDNNDHDDMMMHHQPLTWWWWWHWFLKIDKLVVFQECLHSRACLLCSPCSLQVLFHFCQIAFVISMFSPFPFLFFFTFAFSVSCQMVQFWQSCSGLATTWWRRSMTPGREATLVSIHSGHIKSWHRYVFLNI